MSRAREIADLIGGPTPDIILKTADGAILNLQTSDTTVTDGSVLGAVNFTAPNEASGTDALLVGASIQAISEGTFAADNNATELVFMTGATATASARFIIASDGSLSTPTLGTSNVRFGVNAGDAIVSGGNYNVCLGDESGTGLTTGDRNVTVGFSAGKLATTPNDLIAIGYEAGGGAVLTGANNILLGTDAGHDLTSGAGNVFIGTETGDKTDDGANNVGIGLRALGANCGNSNVAIGDTALAVTTSAENTAVGSGAGSNLIDVSGGVFVGQHSGLFATTASNSTFVGHSAGQGITGAKLTGNDNTAVGTNAGLLLQGAGTTNTLIGKDAGRALTTAEQSCVVGAGAGVALTGSKNTLVGADSGNAITSGAKSTVIGRFNGNANSVDIRTSDNNVVLSDGDGVPRLHVNAAGQVSMGSTMAFGGSGYTSTGFTFNYSGADYVAAFKTLSSTAGHMNGPLIDYVNAAPNGSGNAFISCTDSGASRFRVRSDGGIANFQSNNANLSDSRVKTDIEALGSMWDKFKAIEIVNFKYRDQSHENLNIGVIAQQVESVADEFVDNSGWGETVEGEDPLKSIFTTDLYHATIKALQEAMTRIETLEANSSVLEQEAGYHLDNLILDGTNGSSADAGDDIILG